MVMILKIRKGQLSVTARTENTFLKMFRTNCLAGLALLVGVAYMSYDYDYDYYNKGYDYDYKSEIEDNWSCSNCLCKYEYNCTTYVFEDCPKKSLQCERPIKDCGCTRCKGCTGCKTCFDVSCLKKTQGCQIKGEPGKLCTVASYLISCRGIDN